MTSDTPEIPKTSPDQLSELKSSLSELYPGLFNGDGQLVNSELEKLATGFEATDERERYEFSWTGKTASKRVAYTPSRATLRPEPKRSQNFDTTENVIIEGDNLEVLKLLQASYSKQVKCIYIDPPYNTGNDFVYRDNFASSREQYWQQAGYKTGDGVRLDSNNEASGRYHSDWLSMMQSRLLLARQLLSDDGAIFVSIDDNEVQNLRKLMDEVFGSENFVAQIIWKKKYSPQNDATYFSVMHDYILCYARRKKENKNDKLGFQLSLLERTEEQDRAYQNPDNDPRGVWKVTDATSNKTRSQRPTLYYPVVNPNTGKEVYPLESGVWRLTPDEFKRREEDNRIWWGKDGTNRAPALKSFLTEVLAGRVPQTIWDYSEVGHTQEAKQEVLQLFGGIPVFDTPKPVRLMKRIIKLASAENDVVLDFFAGSGAFAQGVMELNADDGENRRFILVQMPEATDEDSEGYKAGYKTISQICIERVKRAGAKITKEGIDTGFKVYELSASNFPENNFAADADKSPAENAKLFDLYVKQANQTSLFDGEQSSLLAEIALKDGFKLNFKASSIKSYEHNQVFLLGDGTKSAIVCLDPKLDPITIEQLREHTSTRFICLEAALDTSKKWTLKQIFGSNLWVA